MSSKPLTEKQYQRWQKQMRICRKIFRCHQLPDRSFFFHGKQFPICARCTGIVLGIILSPLICIFLPENIYVSIFLGSFMLLDGFTQLYGIRESNNITRLVTGLLFGYSIISFLFYLLNLIFN